MREILLFVTFYFVLAVSAMTYVAYVDVFNGHSFDQVLQPYLPEFQTPEQ